METFMALVLIPLLLPFLLNEKHKRRSKILSAAEIQRNIIARRNCISKQMRYITKMEEN